MRREKLDPFPMRFTDCRDLQSAAIYRLHSERLNYQGCPLRRLNTTLS